MENINIIKELLVKDGWDIEDKNGKIFVYNSGIRSEETTFYCSEDGVYYYNRGKECCFANFNSFELNALALYCRCSNNYNIKREIEKYEAFLSTCNSNEILDFLKKYFGDEFLNKNLNIDSSVIKDNAFNINQEYDMNYIYYCLNNNFINIDGCANVQRFYLKLFQNLLYKENFEKTFLDLIDSKNINSEQILRYYSMYYQKSDIEVLEIKEI